MLRKLSIFYLHSCRLAFISIQLKMNTKYGETLLLKEGKPIDILFVGLCLHILTISVAWWGMFPLKKFRKFTVLHLWLAYMYSLRFLFVFPWSLSFMYSFPWFVYMLGLDMWSSAFSFCAAYWGAFAYLMFELYSHKLLWSTFLKIAKDITSNIDFGKLSPCRTYILIIIVSCM